MLLTISDEMSVKKLVNPRFQTVRLIRGAPAAATAAAPSAWADAGAREKIRAQSMLYMGCGVRRSAGYLKIPVLPSGSGSPDMQRRMSVVERVKRTGRQVFAQGALPVWHAD